MRASRCARENCTFLFAATVSSLDFGDIDAVIQQAKEAKRQRKSLKVHSYDPHSKLRDEHRPYSKQTRLQLLLQHRAVQEVRSEEVTDENLNPRRTKKKDESKTNPPSPRKKKDQKSHATMFLWYEKLPRRPTRTKIMFTTFKNNHYDSNAEDPDYPDDDKYFQKQLDV
nr:uncharacterized protein LOC126538970 [Dermacentor andersoni]